MVDQITQGRTKGVHKTKQYGKAVVKGGGGTAARVASLLGGIYSWGEKRGLVSGLNPARGVETARYAPRDRVCSTSELRALGKGLADRKPTACCRDRLAAHCVDRSKARRGRRPPLERNRRSRALPAPLRYQDRQVGASDLAWPPCLLRTAPKVSDIWVFPDESCKKERGHGRRGHRSLSRFRKRQLRGS